jgi:hypothetical protein
MAMADALCSLLAAHVHIAQRGQTVCAAAKLNRWRQRVKELEPDYIGDQQMRAAWSKSSSSGAAAAAAASTHVASNPLPAGSVRLGGAGAVEFKCRFIQPYEQEEDGAVEQQQGRSHGHLFPRFPPLPCATNEFSLPPELLAPNSEGSVDPPFVRFPALLCPQEEFTLPLELQCHCIAALGGWPRVKLLHLFNSFLDSLSAENRRWFWLPLYYNSYPVVARPRSLSEVRDSFKAGEYDANPARFFKHMALIWSNEQKIGGHGSMVYALATECRNLWEEAVAMHIKGHERATINGHSPSSAAVPEQSNGAAVAASTAGGSVQDGDAAMQDVMRPPAAVAAGRGVKRPASAMNTAAAAKDSSPTSPPSKRPMMVQHASTSGSLTANAVSGSVTVDAPSMAAVAPTSTAGPSLSHTAHSAAAQAAAVSGAVSAVAPQCSTTVVAKPPSRVLIPLAGRNSSMANAPASTSSSFLVTPAVATSGGRRASSEGSSILSPLVKGRRHQQQRTQQKRLATF